MQDDELQRLRRQLEAAVSGLPPPGEAIPMLTEIVEPAGEPETAENRESVEEGESAAIRERADGNRPADAIDASDTSARQEPGIDAMTLATEAALARLFDEPALLDAAVREAVKAATARFAESLESALKTALRERLESTLASPREPAPTPDLARYPASGLARDPGRDDHDVPGSPL